MSSSFATIRAALGLATLLGGLGLSGGADAQESKLPACPTDQKKRFHNCYGTSNNNGQIYVGEFRDGEISGQGTVTWPSGEKYVGEFMDNKRNGQGTYTLPDGQKYVGEYRDDKRNGQGTYTLADGAKYVGEWKDDKRSGKGTHTLADGRQYVGEFKDGEISGQGTHTSPDGKKYVGEFRGNKLSGQGTLTWPDGQKYVGEYRDGKMNGQGTYTLADGAKYVGEWKDDKRSGKGTYTFPDGRKYVGEWKEGKRSGKGTYTFPDGEQYVGNFVDGKLSGQGTLTLPSGQNYVGEFWDDKRNGQGTHTWPDGKKYVGEYRDDKRNGQGIEYASDGSVLQMGIWANGEFIRSANVTPPAARASPPVAASPSPPSSGAKASSGTAFRIASGQFVTNHHVINGCNWLTVNGKLGGRLLASDQTRDLAIVSISNDSGPIASIRTTRIQLNESITAAGFPLEGAFSGIAITNGTISRLSGLRGDTGEVQISAPVQPGNSGGPLLDSAGNVIGVVSSKLNALKVAGASGDIPQNVNFAINGSSLRAFLDAKNVNYKEVGNERELTGVQIAARASAFTVLIECQR